MELKGPGNNLLCSLATKPAQWHGLTFCLARGLHWQLQGMGPDLLGLTGTSRNKRKLFLCLQVVSPHYTSKEATARLPSNSSIPIHGHCWGQSLSGKQDSHSSVFSCASPDCTAGQRLMDEKGVWEVSETVWGSSAGLSVHLPAQPSPLCILVLPPHKQGPGTLLELSWLWSPGWQACRGEAARTANSMIMMYQGAVNLCRNAESLGKTEMKEH